MILILMIYIIGYVLCLKILITNINLLDQMIIVVATLVIQLAIINYVNAMGGNIILLFLIGIEMLVCLIYFSLKKNRLQKIPAILLVFLLFVTNTQFSELLLFKVFEISYISQESDFTLIVVNSVNSFVLTLLLVWLVVFFYKKWEVDKIHLAQKQLIWICGLIISMIMCFFIENINIENSTSNFTNKLITNTYMSMLIILSMCFLITVFLIRKKISDNRLKYEITLNLQLKNYLQSLEALENVQRQFKHDFINIYSGLSGYIENNDLEGLRKYYYQEIININSEQNRKIFQLTSLKNINIIEVKGLLSLKITKANTEKIDVNIEIIDVVDKIDIEVYKFNLCLGILLDNAIEEVRNFKNQERVVNVTLLIDNNALVTIVKNKLNHSINLDRIFKKGYSTKGDNRGLGLTEVERIVADNDNLSLETTVDGSFIIQKLVIYKKEA